jgi:hypothetical protein
LNSRLSTAPESPFLPAIDKLTSVFVLFVEAAVPVCALKYSYLALPVIEISASAAAETVVATAAAISFFHNNLH